MDQQLNGAGQGRGRGAARRRHVSMLAGALLVSLVAGCSTLEDMSRIRSPRSRRRAWR